MFDEFRICCSEKSRLEVLTRLRLLSSRASGGMEASTSYLPPRLSPVASAAIHASPALSRSNSRKRPEKSSPRSSQPIRGSSTTKRSVVGGGGSSAGCRLLWRGKLVVDSDKGKGRALYGQCSCLDRCSPVLIALCTARNRHSRASLLGPATFPSSTCVVFPAFPLRRSLLSRHQSFSGSGHVSRTRDAERRRHQSTQQHSHQFSRACCYARRGSNGHPEGMRWEGEVSCGDADGCEGLRRRAVRRYRYLVREDVLYEGEGGDWSTYRSGR